MTTIRTTILLAFALVATALPMLPSAAADDPAPTLPPACEAALAATRDTLVAQQGIISFPGAVALLQENAGAVCGFNVYTGDVDAVDPRALGEFMRMATPTNIKMNDGGGGGDDLLARLAGRAANLERCSGAGAGTGSIAGYVLAVPIDSEVSVGEWYPVTADIVEVSGDGGLLGGTQTGERGVMRIAGVPVPALQEDSTALCAQTGTVVKEKCWNFGVYKKCETITHVIVEVCGAKADQSLNGLISLAHEYAVDDAPEGCS